MLKIALFAFALLPGLSHAVICKIVAEDGSVTYTDVPAGECPQKVDLPDYSRYAPRPIQQPAARASSATGNTVRFDRYESVAIVQPSSGGTVRNNDGRVPVAVSLTPALQPGHLVMLYLDGNAVGSGFDGTSIELSNVQRGSHSLRASIVDAGGRALIQTATVRFTMRQASRLEPQRLPPTDGDGTDGGDNGNDGASGSGSGSGNGNAKPDTPPFKPDFGSAPPANYTPSTGGTSVTPGATNPAFAPKYTP